MKKHWNKLSSFFLFLLFYFFSNNCLAKDIKLDTTKLINKIIVSKYVNFIFSSVVNVKCEQFSNELPKMLESTVLKSSYHFKEINRIYKQFTIENKEIKSTDCRLIVYNYHDDTMLFSYCIDAQGCLNICGTENYYNNNNLFIYLISKLKYK